MIRVTNQMVLDNVLRNFQANEQQLQVDENKVSTGQAFSQPADDPYGASQAVTFRQRIGQNGQLLRNLDQAQGWLQATDSSLSSINSTLQRARELAIEGANDTLTSADRAQIGDEIHQLLLTAVDVGNTKYGNEFIFGGTKTTDQPFIHDGSAVSPNLSQAPGAAGQITGAAAGLNLGSTFAGNSSFTITGPNGGSATFTIVANETVATLIQQVSQANLGVTASVSSSGRFQLTTISLGAAEKVTMTPVVAGSDLTSVLGLPAAATSASGSNPAAATSSPVKYMGDTGSVARQIDAATQLQVNADGTNLQHVFATLAQLEFDMKNDGTRVSGSVSGLDPIRGQTTGNPNTLETFTINGVTIGTQQNITLNGVNHTVIGFAPSTKLSTIVNQINQQMNGTVTAGIDSNGVLVLQSNVAGQSVSVSHVDVATTDAVTGADLTNGTGVPVSTGGNSAKDLGVSDNMDNAIGSTDVVALDKDLDAMQGISSQIGAKTNRVQSNTARLSSLGTTLAQLDSKTEDVDMAKALSDLATSQTTFQAALGAAAKVLPPTLLDFLR